tara:strand:- start:6341 stop:7213 length:873 start_codon:yes stop_codon:yes gene_type:complete
MSCKIVNKSGMDMSSLTDMAKKFYPYAQKYLGFDKPATIEYQSDPNNAQNPLGTTAHYEPGNYKVTLFVDGRHPKDLLRSLAHELVHHAQNCRGDLTPEKMGETGPGYAQTNSYMRGMEQEAYTKGNLCLRDWEDQYKKQTLQEQKQMSNLDEMVESLVEGVMAELDNLLEASGDRNDSDREQGHGEQRQRADSGGGAGKNEEVDNEDEDVVAEADNENEDVQEEGKGAYRVDDEEEEKDEEVKEEGMYKVDDDESEDDDKEQQDEGLESLFDDRNGKLMERLIKNWATK